MKSSNIQPAMSGKVPFHYQNLNQVPARAGCYLLTNMEEEILYIGKTQSLSRRMGEHLNDPRMTGNTPLGFPTWFYYVTLYPHQTATIEQSMLSQHRYHTGMLPTLNRVGP